MRFFLLLVIFAMSGCATTSSTSKVTETDTGPDCELAQNAVRCRDAALTLMEKEYTPDAANQAFAYLDAACRHQDTIACHTLATLFERGIGTSINMEEAHRLYKANCDGGYTPSCNNLALLVTREGGDLTDAQVLLDLACKGGEAVACFNLGFRAESGSVTANKELAAGYYRRACDMNFAEACYYLGTLVRYGDGVPKDEDAGRDLYEKACVGGYARACSAVGSLYETGSGAAQDTEKALNYYRQACDSGFARGCTNLGVAAEKQGGGASLFDLACNRGDAKGCSRLGVLQLQGLNGVDKDPKKALRSFLRSCELGHGAGCSNLGVVYEDGLGVTKDETLAAELYDRACAMEEMQGCHNLATMVREGRGVPKNLETSTDLYMKACEGGNPHSCSVLGDLWLQDEKMRRFGIELLRRGCTEGDTFGCEQLAKVESPEG